MTQRLEGKVAIVTGASRGLGFRISQGLVADGAKVVMVARGAGDLSAAAATLGANAVAIPGDLGQPQSVRELFAATIEQFGKLDILINNAAVGYPQKIEALEDGLLRAEIDINLLGPIYCIREAIPLLRATGGGDIVNVTSESVGRPFPFLGVYGAAKAGIEALSRHLREELAEDGIRVAIVRSGRMGESGLSSSWSAETRAQYVQEATALGLYHYSGGAISPASTAQAIVDMLCLPREAHVDFLELRSNIRFTPKTR